MGTPDFSVPVLQALVDAGHDVVASYSQPPRRAGRGKALTPSPVQARAETLGIPVRTPVSLRDAAAQAEFAGFGADVAVVAAYGLILPRAVLDAPTRGCLNVHASLLPRWRGAAPIQRAILAGDAATGVCIMQMEAGLDTGPVLLERRTPIGQYDTTGILTQKLSLMGADLLVGVVSQLEKYRPVPQPAEGITYAKKIEKSEARIVWSVGSLQVFRQVLAFNPSPGAWFEYNGERLKVLEARILSDDSAEYRVSFRTEPGVVIGDQLAIGCGEGAIRPTLLQRAGRGVMTTTELLRGFPIPPGTRL